MKFGEFSGIVSKAVGNLNKRELDLGIESIAQNGEGADKLAAMKLTQELIVGILRVRRNLLLALGSAEKKKLRKIGKEGVKKLQEMDLDDSSVADFIGIVEDDMKLAPEYNDALVKTFADEILSEVKSALSKQYLIDLDMNNKKSKER